MRYCVRCGKQNQDSSHFCFSCGTQLVSSDAIALNADISKSEWHDPRLADRHFRRSRPIWWNYDPEDKQKVRKDRRRCYLDAISVFAVITTIFLVIFSAVNGTGWLGSASAIYIDVTSTHPRGAVTVTVMVNGHQIAKESLSPLETKTFIFKPIFFDSTSQYTIKAISEGDGLGSTQDSNSVSLDNGATVNVHLSI